MRLSSIILVVIGIDSFISKFAAFTILSLDFGNMVNCGIDGLSPIIRGKDRHPYPVGYVAHRNNNGNTYKMAIIEGLKGPEFVISSTDGQSCSGQTPDIAWEGFQKKSCVRIKFWRGKRFSCKIDGAELFGFKNPHVMRLLRGLKTNVSQITEPSLPLSSFGNGESKVTHEPNTCSPVYSAETCKYTDLQVDLVKTQDKGKRSKKRKETHVKSVSEDEHKRGRPQDHTQRDDGPDSRQSCEGNHNKEIPSRSSDINENSTGLEKMAYCGNNTPHVTSAKDGLQLDSSISSEHHEKEKRLSVQEASDFISSEDLKFIERDINLLKSQEHLDVSMSNHTRGLTSSKTVDDKGDPPVQKDSQLLDHLDLYAPDTMDPFVDSEIQKESTFTINEKLKSARKGTCTVKDKINSPGISVSEKCVTESQLKDEMFIAENSEKTKSLEQIQGEKLGGEVHVPDKVYTESFKSEKQNENVLFSSTCVSSAIPDSEDLATVAPDSFENDQCEVKELSQAGQVQGAAKTDQSTLGLKGGDGDASVSSMPICRDLRGDLVTETCSTSNVSAIDSQIDKTRPDKQIHRHQTDRNLTGSNSTSFVIATVPPPQDAFSPDYKTTSDIYGASLKCEEPSQASDYSELLEILDNVETKMAHNGEGVKDSLPSDMLTKMAPNDELENIFELVGSYMHPMPISMVMLRTKGNEVYICVLCGYLMEKDRKLLIYKASIKGENRGCPSFIGHTTIMSPISNNASGRQILLDSSSLQFTPDGKCLVLLNNIKASYCREGSVDCQCSVCTSDSFEKNAVKVVQVKLGYVQIVCKLKTTNDVGSILVCEPSYLVAAEEGGRMNLWTMNSQWSAPTDKCYLPTSDSKSNCIVGLKRIPNFPDLIVGHSAFGDFYLWDLRRRIIVSKFLAPGTSYQPFLPINLYRFPSQAFSTTGACTKKQVADIMEETQKWSLETNNHASFPVKEDDLSLVLLMPSVSNLDLLDKDPYEDSGVSPVGCWSLALLAKSKLVSENALDPSATVAGASAGYGIIGTSDGSLYIWELATGTKLGYLSNCRGATMSCLTADDSDSGAFAVAVDGSQLQVYAPGTSANRKHA
uniref:Putative FY-rich, FY-rich, WD40/YVTN repeat-like-containing domain protein n=1 Tax=Tanacetum cinerariifolium TaxID=118510 RepID=A0A6L2JRY2_TANCI|nr:putative FY-rich, FY-rich, WD40/YVTN repeat-like-containing domain protein [Tanacetum cinerariifolium]